MSEHEKATPVEVDLTEPGIARALTTLDHIEAAMTLVGRDGSAFAALASAKHSVEVHLGTTLYGRARAAAKAATSE